MTVRRRRAKTRGGELDHYQVLAIRLGRNWSNAFASDDDWRAAYLERRDELIDEYARLEPGVRPESFWAIEGPPSLRDDVLHAGGEAAGDGYDWDERIAARGAYRRAFMDRRRAYLRKHDLLLPGERP